MKYQPTLDTSINICPQIDGYNLEYLSSFPSALATKISYPFYISLKPPLATQFSRHIVSNVFDQSFHISTVFQNRIFDLLPVMQHAHYLQ